MNAALNIVEAGWVPDVLTRLGIRNLLQKRLANAQAFPDRKASLIQKMSQGPLAVASATANQQHYELPANFFKLMLGESMKYSCALYSDGVSTLEEAETAMLNLTINRAGITDGMQILELGCGWGSLTLAMAKKFRKSQILAISNSRDQKLFIDEKAKQNGITNITIMTEDMNNLVISEKFDRIVSVEMFEHMRNYRELFSRIASWLAPEGRLFFHVFCHRNTPYFFSDDSDADWMARHFFTGGVMPSADLPMRIESSLQLDQLWRVNGTNYSHTCRDWLRNLDNNQEKALDILERSDNPTPANIQFNRWRMFVMACQEMFGFRQGQEWFVSHYLFKPKGSQRWKSVSLS